MSHNRSGLSPVGEALLFAGGLGGMAFLGIFGFAALGVWSGALPLDNDLEEEARARRVRLELHSAQRVPGPAGHYPLMPSPYLGTSTLAAGICRRHGSGAIVIVPSPFFSSSTQAHQAWCCGMRAYEGFSSPSEAFIGSQRVRLQAMADGELCGLMEEIVQESKRRQSARSGFGCQQIV
jgi:hypothetical protein